MCAFSAEVTEPAELMDRAFAYAEQLLANSANAVQVAKEAVLRSMGLPLDEAFRLEAEIGQKAFWDPDAKEGIKAFFEKRKPEFPSKRW